MTKYVIVALWALLMCSAVLSAPVKGSTEDKASKSAPASKKSAIEADPEEDASGVESARHVIPNAQADESSGGSESESGDTSKKENVPAGSPAEDEKAEDGNEAERSDNVDTTSEATLASSGAPDNNDASSSENEPKSADQDRKKDEVSSDAQSESEKPSLKREAVPQGAGDVQAEAKDGGIQDGDDQNADKGQKKDKVPTEAKSESEEELVKKDTVPNERDNYDTESNIGDSQDGDARKADVEGVSMGEKKDEVSTESESKTAKQSSKKEAMPEGDDSKEANTNDGGSQDGDADGEEKKNQVAAEAEWKPGNEQAKKETIATTEDDEALKTEEDDSDEGDGSVEKKSELSKRHGDYGDEDEHHHEHEHEHGHHHHHHDHHHHGHHHGFVHEWGEEEGGEHHGEGGHHHHEHEHEHEHGHHHHEHEEEGEYGDHHGGYGGGEGGYGGGGGGGGYGWGRRSFGVPGSAPAPGPVAFAPASPVAYHCRDIVAKNGKHKSPSRRQCVPIGGYGWPTWQSYAGSPLVAKSTVPTAQSVERDNIAKHSKKQTIHVGYGFASGENYNLGYQKGGMGAISSNFDDHIRPSTDAENLNVKKSDVEVHQQKRNGFRWTKRQFGGPAGHGFGPGGFGMANPYGHPVTHPGFTTMGFPGQAVASADVKDEIPRPKAKRQIYGPEPQGDQDMYPQEGQAMGNGPGMEQGPGSDQQVPEFPGMMSGSPEPAGAPPTALESDENASMRSMMPVFQQPTFEQIAAMAGYGSSPIPERQF